MLGASQPLLHTYVRIYQVVTTLETLYSSDRRTAPAEILLRLHTSSGTSSNASCIATDTVLIQPRPGSMNNNKRAQGAPPHTNVNDAHAPQNP